LIRILLDQGLPRSTGNHLQDEKWDILHVGDIGLSRAKDTELIEYARENRRVIITLDSDFHAFLAVTNANSPSVIRIRIEGLKGPDMAGLIKQIWPKIEFSVKQGAMVTVTKKSIRIHDLLLS
jgi:predicted nuclease of predicted toxin-antitoxin system